MKLPGLAIQTVYAGDVCTYEPSNGHIEPCTKEEYDKMFNPDPVVSSDIIVLSRQKFRAAMERVSGRPMTIEITNDPIKANETAKTWLEIELFGEE